MANHDVTARLCRVKTERICTDWGREVQKLRQWTADFCLHLNSTGVGRDGGGNQRIAARGLAPAGENSPTNAPTRRLLASHAPGQSGNNVLAVDGKTLCRALPSARASCPTGDAGWASGALGWACPPNSGACFRGRVHCARALASASPVPSLILYFVPFFIGDA